ncbi:hypothetical protein J6590_024434 [Homalodisca vitripennis]|nr:hypothetical protein J6590_024434 [Homalodisca vitripennis]
MAEKEGYHRRHVTMAGHVMLAHTICSHDAEQTLGVRGRASWAAITPLITPTGHE